MAERKILDYNGLSLYDSTLKEYIMNAIDAINMNALQEIITTENGGLKVINKNQIEIDDDITFIFDCGTSTGYNDEEEERLEGDGAEFYTLAPAPLSFRSDAPLNELQDVQINGVTVDPSNYTLEEGSTIVTFPIDYLKTLETGDYEVTVVSESKSVKGGFTVAAPKLNEHGFYYNQPYMAYVSILGTKVAFFVREDGTFDSITESGATETGTYEIVGNDIVSINSLGTLHSTISADGTSIYCNEIRTTFVLGDESIAADEDYLYIYKEDLGGYEVIAIDKTKAEYGAIKTGINGIDTVKLGDGAFEANIGETSNLQRLPEMPDSLIYFGMYCFRSCNVLTNATISRGVTTIDSHAFCDCTNLVSVVIPNSITSINALSFGYCTKLTSINFEGTMEQWNAISKYTNISDNGWNKNVPATHVQCSDGTVEL